MRSGGSVRLGRVAGIPILLDYSFFLIFGLLIFLLGVDILPSMIDPDPAPAVLWALAALSGLLFFLSLLLHELAHSLVARGYGLPVRDITLFMLGGVSQITREPPRARQEFIIAVVGPLTSAVLGGIFLAIFALGGLDDSPGGAMVSYLGLINLLLAVFNLLPGFPLDGGRVLRALLWGVTGSHARATRWAARGGQGVALLLAGVGLFNFVGASLGIATAPVGGIFWVFIGLFLYNAATQTLRAAAAEAILAGMSVRDLMSTRLRTLEADTPLRWIGGRQEGLRPDEAFLVTRDEVVVGMVLGSQIRDLSPERFATAALADIMIPADRVAPIAPSASGKEALERLQGENLSVLPVVEGGRLLGLVGLAQVFAALGRVQQQSRPAAG